MRTRIFCLSLITMMGVASLANADPITIPSGLAPGSTYFLAFVTAGTRDATSSNIADYDAFVTAEANLDPMLAALGTTWKVIGSTPTVNAITHIGVTGPVYNLAGLRVATGSPALFDGFDTLLEAPININQYGTTNPVGPGSTLAWTGTDATGIGTTNYELGALSMGTMLGQPAMMTYLWIETAAIDRGDFALSIYGISGPLTTPTEVPEPSTISLMLGGLLLLRRRHQQWRHRLATPTVQSDPVSSMRVP